MINAAALKYYTRFASAWLNAARQVEALFGRAGYDTLALEDAVATVQHHDGVRFAL